MVGARSVERMDGFVGFFGGAGVFVVSVEHVGGGGEKVVEGEDGVAEVRSQIPFLLLAHAGCESAVEEGPVGGETGFREVGGVLVWFCRVGGKAIYSSLLVLGILRV